ncbi:MAG TPA: DoxX family membrane protein [Polyangiaceae bacterium]|jgi:uncharacterized membrane protein YphA (DoxX/SURF4 family)|nr:DoxX family membrane protein [Polyangiaceae bacterium]
MNKKIILGARILLGLVFFVFGLNFFLHFIPQQPMPAAAGAFAGAMFATGYLFVLVKVVEVASGLLLLAGRFVPLALTLLAPIVVNIVFFHAFLAPAGIAVPLVVLALELFLAWSYRDVFRPMLAANVGPSTGVSAPASIDRRSAHTA